MNAVILICAGISVGFGDPKQAADVRREIRALGGTLEFLEDESGGPSQSISVTLCDTKLPPGLIGRMAALPRLETLKLRSMTLPPDIWAQLQNRGGLRNLDIVGCGITDDLAKGLAGLRDLRSLSISCEDMTNAGMKHIGGLSRLRQLLICGDFHAGAQITAAGFAELSALRELQELRIAYIDLDDDSIRAVSKLPKLTSLDVEATGENVTDQGMDDLARVASLKRLSIRGWGYTDRGLAALGRLRALEYLYLYANECVDGSGLRALKDAPKLREIDLFCIPVTDKALKEIAGLNQLKTLRLGNSIVTDAGMESLARMASLEFLDVQGTSVSDRGLVLLESARRLKEVETDDGTAKYSAIPGTARLKRTFITAAEQGRAAPAPPPP